MPKLKNAPNLLAARIVRAATNPEPRPEAEPSKPAEKVKDPLAVELGRRGGLKGGRARAAKLSPKRRRQIAKRAARARWASP